MPSPRIATSLPPELLKKLRYVAADHGTTIGLVARALIAHGVEGADSAPVVAAITDEVRYEKERKGVIGRKAMDTRYKRSTAKGAS